MAVVVAAEHRAEMDCHRPLSTGSISGVGLLLFSLVARYPVQNPELVGDVRRYPADEPLLSGDGRQGWAALHDRDTALRCLRSRHYCRWRKYRVRDAAIGL